MIIECTPAIVNKTAIHRIIREAIGHFAKSNYSFKLQALGKNYSSWQEVEAEQKIPKSMTLLLRFPKLVLPLLNLCNLVCSKQTQEPVLYFDPLYVLFNRIKKSDYVFVLDMSPFTIADFHPPNTVWLYQQAFRKLQSSGCKLISISQSTTNDLRVNLGIRADRIKPIRLFANPQLVESAKAPGHLTVKPKQFLLFVGSLETRKNIKGLLEGFDASGLAKQGIHLVIVGRVGFGGTDVLHLFKSLANVHWVGAVSDAELAWYYENTLAFVYPSFWEGFGVPLLEALRYDCPCLCTTTGASPEVGGEAVFYCDPCDTRSIANGMVAITKIGQDASAKALLLKTKDSILNNFTTANFCKDLDAILIETERSK